MMIIDLLRLVSGLGIPIQEYSYVGLGGAVFYDFEILYRHLGIQRMVSIEHSQQLLDRCEFNKPFKFIDIFSGTTAEYLAQHRFSGPAIVWFDYDWRLSSMATADLEALGTLLPPGSIFFVTLCADPPKIFGEQALSAQEKVEWLQEELQGASAACTSADVSNSKFRFYVERVMKTAAQYAFATRRDGKLIQLLNLFYRDSNWMYTFGGAFADTTTSAKIIKQVRRNMPFLLGTKAFEIPDFNISPRERKLFDQLCSGKKRRTAATLAVSKLGFSDEDVVKYGNLMRYIPRYTQTFL